MRTFAQIQDGKLHWRFEVEDGQDAPEFSTDLIIIEITGTSPMPDEGWDWDGTVFTPMVNWMSGPTLAEHINDSVAQVTSTWTRFEAEYVFREKAAIDYKANNYTGDASIWITAFASAAGLTNKKASDLILAQAAGLRVAQETLGALRMRKYELLPLSGQAAMDKYTELDAAIQQAIALVS